MDRSNERERLKRLLEKVSEPFAKCCHASGKSIKDLKITLLGHDLKYVSRFDFHDGGRVKLDFWWGGKDDKEGDFSIDVPIEWVKLSFKD